MSDRIDTVYTRYFSSIGNGVKPEQRKVIQSILDGNDTLSLMPTGGGKSLCYWIAGLALGGTTLAVFPLTALMDEQAAKLRSHGLKVLVLHSGIDWKKQVVALLDFAHGGELDFILVSPERLAADGLLEAVIRSACDRVRLFVIDEIHCISQWGTDFRPFYKEFPYFIESVWGNAQTRPAVLGLTATLSRADTLEIKKDFHIRDENVIPSKYLLRHGIKLKAVQVNDENEKERLVWELLEQHRDDKVLVYVENRFSGERSTEGFAESARALGFMAEHFHGSVSTDRKAAVIKAFKEGDIKTVFATSAFGMGIDIPDIRGVVHFRPPESIEQYYQQLGRVGRDGKTAWATIFYSAKNFDYQKKQFIDKRLPTLQSLTEAFDNIFAGPGNVRTLDYYDDEQTQANYHYLLRSSAFDLLCKGASSLKGLEKAPGVALPEFDRYLEATKTATLVRIANQLGESPCTIMRNVYSWLIARKIRFAQLPDKRLVVEANVDALPDEMVAAALDDAAQIRAYKYEQLDRLKALLDSYTDSTQLHQAIGDHLGIDKFHLGRIHQTSSGDWVRSKSEVIIANLLWERRIPFEYEASVSAGGKQLSPDFTIRLGDSIWYWEHLGMLGNADYDANWASKKPLYDQYFPGQLITTEESAILSRTAESIINDLLSKSARQSL